MRTHPYLNKLIEQANSSHLLLLRLREWSRTIRWEINGEDYYWSTKDGKLSFAEKTEPDFTLQSSNDTLQRNNEIKASNLYTKSRDLYLKLEYLEKKEIYDDLLKLYNKLSKLR